MGFIQWMETTVGIGDEIIGSRHAKEKSIREQLPVTMLGKENQIRKHPVWHYNPFIAYERMNMHSTLHWNSSCRPYVNYKKCTVNKWAFNEDYKVLPGNITLSNKEMEEAVRHKDYILIEPTVKGPLQINKDWGMHNWQQLALITKDVPWIQLIYDDNQDTLPGVTYIKVRTIREWLVWVHGAIAVVTTDGGLHHAAAAFNIPAIVLFSGFIHPNIMGYQIKGHNNLYCPTQYMPADPVGHSQDESCGSKIYCDYCYRNINNIRPHDVRRELLNLPIGEST